ncbi:acyl-coenzyme A thioesterase THEM4 [Diretmus argenteus]
MPATQKPHVKATPPSFLPGMKREDRQAVQQELNLHGLKTRLVRNSVEIKRKEEAIVQMKTKIQDMNKELASLNTKRGELTKRKEETLKAKGDMDKNLESCNTEKAEAEKKKTDLTEALNKLKAEHEDGKKKAQEEIQSLKQQILDRDKAICAFVDKTNEEGRFTHIKMQPSLQNSRSFSLSLVWRDDSEEIRHDETPAEALPDFRSHTAVHTGLPWPLSTTPRDFSLPNSSWSAEMMQLYEHYNSQCEVETEGGEKKGGPWTRMPSYNRTLKFLKGGFYMSQIIQSKARLFTRNIRAPGAAFEYVVFYNKEEQKCVCIFQAGHLLEGPPGHVHGGAIATMIDDVAGTLAYQSSHVMTANLNINYRSPIPLGSTVLLHCSVDKKEGRKIFISCKVTSTDGSKLHTEATVLFLSVTLSHLL